MSEVTSRTYYTDSGWYASCWYYARYVATRRPHPRAPVGPTTQLTKVMIASVNSLRGSLQCRHLPPKMAASMEASPPKPAKPTPTASEKGSMTSASAGFYAQMAGAAAATSENSFVSTCGCAASRNGSSVSINSISIARNGSIPLSNFISHRTCLAQCGSLIRECLVSQMKPPPFQSALCQACDFLLVFAQ